MVLEEVSVKVSLTSDKKRDDVGKVSIIIKKRVTSIMDDPLGIEPDTLLEKSKQSFL
jgi:hypothetical protein